MSLFDQFNWQGEQGFPYWSGYYWIGPVQPHIIPQAPGLTDITTGTVYYITLNAGGTALVLVTTKPPGPQRVLPASDLLPVGSDGYGLYVDSGVLKFKKQLGIAGPGPFAPNSQSGVATLIAGLYMTDATLKHPVFAPDRIGFVVANIVSKTTPAEPTMIPPVVVYQGYYYDLQDAKNSGKLS
jgi:hypothetical protein